MKYTWKATIFFNVSLNVNVAGKEVTGEEGVFFLLDINFKTTEQHYLY